ncbi:MAG: PaaI family thioesterase [Armatimonadetes bacterium]|nr:PaaI family thioesterase [Armatimonadota bacterium]
MDEEKLYLPISDSCYVCGKINPFGLHVRFHLDSGEVRTEFIADEHRCGFQGIVHGGVLSTLLDETMGWAPAYQKRLFCYAAELRIRFLQPAPSGQPLRVSGRMTADRGRVWETEGEVRGADGSLYAKGWGKYMPMTPEQTVDVIGHLHFDEETIPRHELLPTSPSTGE